MFRNAASALHPASWIELPMRPSLANRIDLGPFVLQPPSYEGVGDSEQVGGIGQELWATTRVLLRGLEPVGGCEGSAGRGFGVDLRPPGRAILPNCLV